LIATTEDPRYATANVCSNIRAVEQTQKDKYRNVLTPLCKLDFPQNVTVSFSKVEPPMESKGFILSRSLHRVHIGTVIFGQVLASWYRK
jgi:hypothetical protein